MIIMVTVKTIMTTRKLGKVMMITMSVRIVVKMTMITMIAIKMIMMRTMLKMVARCKLDTNLLLSMTVADVK